MKSSGSVELRCLGYGFLIIIRRRKLEYIHGENSSINLQLYRYMPRMLMLCEILLELHADGGKQKKELYIGKYSKPCFHRPCMKTRRGVPRYIEVESHSAALTPVMPHPLAP